MIVLYKLYFEKSLVIANNKLKVTVEKKIEVLVENVVENVIAVKSHNAISPFWIQIS